MKGNLVLIKLYRKLDQTFGELLNENNGCVVGSHTFVLHISNTPSAEKRGDKWAHEHQLRLKTKENEMMHALAFEECYLSEHNLPYACLPLPHNSLDFHVNTSNNFVKKKRCELATFS